MRLSGFFLGKISPLILIHKMHHYLLMKQQTIVSQTPLIYKAAPAAFFYSFERSTQ